MLKHLIGISIALQAWSLHTGAPVTISDLRFDAIWPEAAIDAQGRAAVSWISSQGRQETLTLAYREGGSWSDAQMLSDWGHEVGLHRCHLDLSGNLSVFWERLSEAEDHLYWISKPLGKPWGQLEKYNRTSEYFSKRGVAFEPNGQITGTCIETPRATHAWEQRYLVQSIPFLKEERTTLYNSSTYIPSANMILDQEGRGLIYWTESEYDSNGSITTLVGLWKTAENQWSAPETICYLRGNSFSNAEVSVSSGKNGAFVIKHEDKFLAVVHSEEGWSDVTEIAGLDNSYPGFKVDIDSKGNILTVWRSEKLISGVYKLAGQSWSHLWELSSEKDEVAQASVINDQAGHFIIVWTEVEKNIPMIWGAQFSIANAKLSKAVLLSPEGKSCHSPSIAFAEGKGIISWVTTDNGLNTFVQAANLILD